MKKIITIILLLIISMQSISFAKERDEEFDRQLNLLKSPKEIMLEKNTAEVRVGDKFVLPQIDKEIIPTDLKEEYTVSKKLSIENLNPEILKLYDNAIVEALKNGTAIIIIDGNEFKIEINDKNTPLSIQNLIYIGKKEFLLNKMQRLPKYNQYAKWYYKKRKEVGWCSVFASYCANASGLNTYKYNTINKSLVNKDYVFALLEGQVGHQWDGYSSVDRFTNIPKPGYYVIYGNTKNAYKFTHIGLIIDVIEAGNGLYQITTVEGNMSNTVKCYSYLYDSNIEHPKKNIFEIKKENQTNPLIQYTEHTGYWSVFGFCATWE